MPEDVRFDRDGTPIDSTDAIIDSFRHAFATLGDTVPERKRIVETIGVPLEERFRTLSACVRPEGLSRPKPHPESLGLN